MAEIKRVTENQRFTDAVALLRGETPPNGSTVDEVIAQLEHRMAQNAKKSASVSPKKAAEKAQDETYMALISEYLGTLAEDCKGKTCSEISQAIPELNVFNTSKMSSLMGALKDRNEVVREVVKGKALYRLA